MHLRTLGSLLSVAASCACSGAHSDGPSTDARREPDAVDSRPGPAVSIELLRERSEYAALDERSVEARAHLAVARWPEELAAFRYQRVERFSAGGASHWMSIWSHEETGLEFVLAPGGTFEMGSPTSEADRKEDELRHSVTLDPSLIAQSECTQGAWAELASAAGVSGETFEGSALLPKVGISPGDVESWCGRANLALPTEAQWEFMCRAGTTSPRTMGPDKNDLRRFGNIGSAECPQDWLETSGITEDWQDGYGDRAAPVASFDPNAFGLFDVHGNVCEWCRDEYVSYEVPVERGTGRRPGTSGERIARGGNFGGDAAFSRSAARAEFGSGISPGANRAFGFRPSVDLTF